MQRNFNVVIERDSEGWLVASAPSRQGYHTQTKSFDDLDSRIREATALSLKDTEFVGVQRVAVEI